MVNKVQLQEYQVMGKQAMVHNRVQEAGPHQVQEKKVEVLLALLENKVEAPQVLQETKVEALLVLQEQLAETHQVQKHLVEAHQAQRHPAGALQVQKHQVEVLHHLQALVLVHQVQVAHNPPEAVLILEEALALLDLLIGLLVQHLEDLDQLAAPEILQTLIHLQSRKKNRNSSN